MLAWGAIGPALFAVMLFTAAEQVPASTLSVITVVYCFIVFGFAALRGQVRADPKRLAGLVVGFAPLVSLFDEAVGTLHDRHRPGLQRDDASLDFGSAASSGTSTY